MKKNLWYFVSDVHLGLNYKDAIGREKKFADFLYTLPDNTHSLFLLGDIFDFWYEYKNVIPRKFTRTLGALASLVDRGVKVYFFNGNHDVWTYSYFEEEIGIKILKQPFVLDINNSRFCLGHGDGLGSSDKGYKILRGIFDNKLLQVMFSTIHPRWAFGLAHAWSKHNRLAHECKAEALQLPTKSSFKFDPQGADIVRYCENFQQTHKDAPIDYFIFGHFHYKTDLKLINGGELHLLGEWIHNSDYLVYDGKNLVSYTLNI